MDCWCSGAPITRPILPAKTWIAASLKHVVMTALARDGVTIHGDATPRSQMKTVNREVPDYVWTELKIRVARSQVSVRHVVMSALIKDGITIKDADMIEDGRRLNDGAILVRASHFLTAVSLVSVGCSSVGPTETVQPGTSHHAGRRDRPC